MIAWVLGWLWWLVVPVRKRLAVDSYRRCFPERSPGELRRSVGEMAVQYAELALGRRAVVVNPELAEGGGLCLAGHFGAWDIMLVSLASTVPVTAFVRIPSNPIAARVLDRLRSQATDLELITASDSPRKAYDALSRGRLVLLVQDQRLNGGRRVPFFGQDAQTSPGFGAMAWQTRAPLLGVYQWREGGRHFVKLERLELEIPQQRGAAIRQLTADSQRYYEEKIRLRPWSWLWLHNRWR